MSFYYSVASGSSGNCAVWQSGETSVLIDLGVSVRALNQALHRIDMEIPNLSAVLLTHEHTDHIKGLATFVKKYELPVYATFGTGAAILQKLPQAKKNLRLFAGGETFFVCVCSRCRFPTMLQSRLPIALTAAGISSAM